MHVADDAEENAKSEDAHTRNVEDADVVAAGLTTGIMIAGRGLEGEGKGEREGGEGGGRGRGRNVLVDEGRGESGRYKGESLANSRMK